MINIIHNGFRPNYWTEMLFGQKTQSIVVSNTTPPAFNLYGGPIPTDQWACLETRITHNTPGVANGIIQTWVNGVAQINRTDLLLRNAVLTDQNGPASQRQLVRIYVQHGVGTTYYDDLAVSRDARIGCGPLPHNDTLPPAKPKNLRTQ